MKFITLAGLALLGLGGCTDEAAKTFGKTYDECVLKNARGGEAQAALAAPSCRRHFEIKSASQGGVTAEAREELGTVHFSVSNSDSSKIVTAIQIQVTFDDGSGRKPDVLIWTFDTFIEPDRQVQIDGDLGNKQWGSSIRGALVTVLREIPLSR